MKVLFLLKKQTSNYNFTSGLENSSIFISNYLNSQNINTKVSSIIDSNSIDKEVTQCKPDFTIIEALWVVPEKLKELTQLHPNVIWVIRIHSKIPFLANEGIAIKWIKSYYRMFPKKIFLAFNNYDIYRSFKNIYQSKSIIYLPNMYYPERKTIIKSQNIEERTLHIGCFGAIRVLKNNLIQAMAAIIYCNYRNLKLYFHINKNNLEQNGEEIIKNIRNLFHGTPHHLVEHDWMSHVDFLNLVSKMYLGLQVSYSESFNIVAGDFVSQNIPFVGSSDIKWLSIPYKANPMSLMSIKNHIDLALLLSNFNLQCMNNLKLKIYNKFSKYFWKKFLKN